MLKVRLSELNIGRSNRCARLSGEHRPLACPFRQLAEKLFQHSKPKFPCKTWDCRRQAADDYRLAACAPQTSPRRVRSS